MSSGCGNSLGPRSGDPEHAAVLTCAEFGPSTPFVAEIT